jgi:hypothetical protein
MYHGDHVAETGRAIFVSINYRLNIWGFPSSTPVDGLDQNIGIADVRLAIEWVATNIAQFGGDPAQIIFSGQSAGAGIGEELLYAFEKDPIFVGQIAISGPVGQPGAAPTDGTSWNLVSNALGCGNFTDVSQVSRVSEFHIHTNVYTWCVKVSCMRNVNFDQINNATLQLKTSFGPFTDGTIILDHAAYLARGANGSFAHVPALISNVNDEASLFMEPYSSFYPNGTTADSVADTVVCGAGMSLLSWGTIMIADCRFCSTRCVQQTQSKHTDMEGAIYGTMAQSRAISQRLQCWCLAWVRYPSCIWNVCGSQYWEWHNNRGRAAVVGTADGCIVNICKSEIRGLADPLFKY